MKLEDAFKVVVVTKREHRYRKIPSLSFYFKNGDSIFFDREEDMEADEKSYIV